MFICIQLNDEITSGYIEKFVTEQDKQLQGKISI